jgi:hypothetical protein
VAPIYHRKLWEVSYIDQALWRAGKLQSGMAGPGFGCGQEVLPSLFAKHAHVSNEAASRTQGRPKQHKHKWLGHRRQHSEGSATRV